MKPLNNFIDETAMKMSGEPLEYVPTFAPNTPGLVVREASFEEWEQAVHAQTLSQTP